MNLGLVAMVINSIISWPSSLSLTVPLLVVLHGVYPWRLLHRTAATERLLKPNGDGSNGRAELVRGMQQLIVGAAFQEFHDQAP